MTRAIFTGLTNNLHRDLEQYRAETRSAYVHDLISEDDRETIYAAIHILKLASRRAIEVERGGASGGASPAAGTIGVERPVSLSSEKTDLL